MTPQSAGKVSVLYQLVLPLTLRDFMRETYGKLVVVEEQKVRARCRTFACVLPHRTR